MKHIGLFEGIGGFSLAARWMGWETIAYSEIDPFCLKVLKYHFPNAAALGDINEIDFTPYANRVDILTGGFPCQPYSVAGKRYGKNDARHLWPQKFRAIREIKPKWIVGENVRGLINWNRGLVFEEIQCDLEAEGYEVQPFLFPACAVGAPHERYRVFIVAYRNRIGCQSGAQAADGRQEQIKEGKNIRNKTFTTTPGEFVTESSAGRHTFGNAEEGQNHSSNDTWRTNSVFNWGDFPSQSPVFSRNDGLSFGLDGITVPSWRKESVKAYGNAIVPQLAYQIFKAIELYDNNRL